MSHNIQHAGVPLKGGAAYFISARVVTVTLLGLAILCALYMGLSAGGVFQLNDTGVALTAIYGTAFVLFLIAGIAYGLFEADPLPVARQTVGLITLSATLLFGTIAAVIGFGAFSPATTDIKQALVISNAVFAGLLGIVSIYLSIPPS